jgi:hypothetical protein
LSRLDTRIYDSCLRIALRRRLATSKLSGMSTADPRVPRNMGLRRYKRDQADCGLCGTYAKMSKTHVPPQCAGNTDRKVPRVRLVFKDGSVKQTPPLAGGLYVYGLCESCNGLQAKYDSAYGEFAKAVRNLWLKDWKLIFTRANLPSTDVDVGSVARSILIGFYGTNPGLRTAHTGLAKQLLDEASNITPPPDIHLRLALARGTKALLSGPSGGFLHNLRAPEGGAYGFASLAQVYLPPLAWQLTGPHSDSAIVPSDTPSLLDREGWADVTDWLTSPIGTLSKLSDACHSLPYVAHPRHHPRYANSWIEMFGDSTEILECPAVAYTILR